MDSRRRFSVQLPTSLAEDLAGCAVRSGIRPSDVIEQAVLEYAPLRKYIESRTTRGTRFDSAPFSVTAQ